jgi:hypothetical protein
MAVYLTVLTALLLGIAALGIFGLAAFNVSTRTKQIGTRRAVGARRTDVVRYFLVENWLDHDSRSALWMRACTFARLLAQHDIRTAASEALLSGGRRGGAVGRGACVRARTGPTRGAEFRLRSQRALSDVQRSCSQAELNARTNDPRHRR